MQRGNTHFKCSDCGKVFKAPDVEYMATSYSVPQPCPQCGKCHTFPLRNWPLGKRLYRQIWKEHDK